MNVQVVKIEETAPSVTHPSALKLLWNEIKSDKVALCALFIFLTITAVVFIWSLASDSEAISRVYVLRVHQPPGGEFLLGTDNAGRDVLPLLIVGARNSLIIAFVVAIVSSAIGVFVGLFSGFYGGQTDNIVMRIIDFFTMIPTLMTIIVIIILLPFHTPVSFAAIMVLFGWIGTARVIRMVTLRQGALDYIHASKTLGTSNIVIIFRELFPNIISFTIVALTLNLAASMGIETGLTFLGFGLPHGTPSLGALLWHATIPFNLQNRLWLWLPAALLILVMMLCINYVGQALNRAADAKRRRV